MNKINQINFIGTIIPIILMLIAYIYGIVDYNKYKNYNRVFIKAFMPFLIIGFTIFSGLSHIFIGDKIGKTIGWGKSGFEKEVGMFQLSIASLGIYYIQKENIRGLVAISMIWILFIIMATILHIKEILIDKNYMYNTIRPVITGTINSIMLCWIISKVDLNKWY